MLWIRKDCRILGRVWDGGESAATRVFKRSRQSVRQDGLKSALRVRVGVCVCVIWNRCGRYGMGTWVR